MYKLSTDNQWESISFIADGKKVNLAEGKTYLLVIDGQEYIAEIGERVGYYYDCGGETKVNSSDLVVRVTNPLEDKFISVYGLIRKGKEVFMKEEL